MNQNDKIKIVTHDNKFHADDVFACAVLTLYFEKEKKEFEILRTRNNEIIKKADIVFDVGGEHDPDRNRFDHHQIGKAGERENLIPYAAFGLVWKKYGKLLCGDEKIANKIDEKIVQPIDAYDNGVVIVEKKFGDIIPMSLSDLVDTYSPIYDSNEDFDTQFYKAVENAKIVLSREIQRKLGEQKAKEKVLEIYENTKDKRLLIFDNHLPWKSTVSKLVEPIFVIFPREDGKYTLHAVPKGDPRDLLYRKYLPAKWGGLRDEDLQKVTGVGDAVFCHNDRFIVIVGSIKGANLLAELALRD